MRKKIEMKGKIFGEITVLEEAGTTPSGNAKWLCKCGCGKEFITTGSNIRTGVTKSCRCLAGKMGRKQLTTHGLTYHPLFNVWQGMKNRCKDKKHFPTYAEKGVNMYEKWKTDYYCFYVFAKNNGWKKGLVVDRIDNLKGYFPENIRFVTHLINNRNTIMSKLWFINGKKYLSSYDAAVGENVSQGSIISWCNGYTSRGKKYPRKPGCFSKKVYDTGTHGV